MVSLTAIVGPTAVGKTRLAVALAQRFGGEIVNADSRQVYRGMNIGAAKPTAEEQRQAPHHLLDLLDPDQPFSLGEFLSLAKKATEDITRRGKLPFLVGGTGQYVWGLLEGWEVPEVPPDPQFRRDLERQAAEKGPGSLFQRLQDVDPARAADLDPRNVRRVIRALEIHHVTGTKASTLGARRGWAGESLVIGLTMSREELYRRVDDRLDRMMRQGLLEEARQLAARGYQLGHGPLDCPGYREMGQFLEEKITLDQAVNRAKLGTHKLVRRQNTWFKPTDPRIHWLNAQDQDLVQQAAALIQDFHRTRTPRPSNGHPSG